MHSSVSSQTSNQKKRGSGGPHNEGDPSAMDFGRHGMEGEQPKSARGDAKRTGKNDRRKQNLR